MKIRELIKYLGRLPDDDKWHHDIIGNSAHEKLFCDQFESKSAFLITLELRLKITSLKESNQIYQNKSQKILQIKLPLIQG